MLNRQKTTRYVVIGLSIIVLVFGACVLALSDFYCSVQVPEQKKYPTVDVNRIAGWSCPAHNLLEKTPAQNIKSHCGYI